MQFIRGVQNLPAAWPGAALTIGNFDGVHRGHRALIAQAGVWARRLNVPLTVLCFEPTPREYFAHEGAPGRISTLRSKLRDLEAAGVDAVVIQRFGMPFCGLGGDTFIDEVVHRQLRAKAVVVGDDFVFGAQRSGNLALLQQRGAVLGFAAEGLGTVSLDALRCSSTAVRAALAQPDLAQVETLLDRPYRILGRVVHGLQLGRQLDMPTANINLRRRPAMRLGVYAVRARLLGDDRLWNGVAAIGVRPTLGITRCLLETHLFDDCGDIYGRLMDVEFRHFLRAEEHFDSLATLQVQMHRDKADAMAFWRLNPIINGFIRGIPPPLVTGPVPAPAPARTPVTDSQDYKATINLPETAFPMQANLAKREPEMLARWRSENLYAQVQAATAGRSAFWFVDGPPYANGDIHIGHAVNKVLKDMIVKAARLDGHQAAFVPGWDCHGLPIELQVEKKFGKVGEKLNAVEFRAKCREYAAEQVTRQREDFERLGVLADWDHPYLTMQPAYEAEQLRVLAQIIDNGHVVRGFKPVHWCLDCGSSLAEAEVEYQDKQSSAIDVKFAVVDAVDLAKRFGVSDASGAGFVIWTTTPWTLPANQAIAVNAELDYALADFGTYGKLIVAAELLEGLAKRYGAAATVLATAKGAALEGARAKHPFASRSVPLICGEHVTLEAGTGLVHTAPAHGVDDYAVGRRYQLPVDNPVASTGVFIGETPIVAGLHVRKAEAPILDALREAGALVHLTTITHSYPHCWRHKTPLIFRATAQWFITMDATGLRASALDAIGKTQWIPDWGKERIEAMVTGRPDWCISRQRTWGVPMAVFIDREKQDLHPDSAALLRRIADAVEKEGLEAWFGSQPSDWGVDGARFEAGTDTLDVWFDSGAAHQCVFKATNPQALDAEGLAPQADIYLEGSDQHRGWFQSSLLTSVAMRGRAPYKAVLTHGFTVDEQGRKMSKSLGNVVAPQQVLKTLGADVLRLWAATSDYSGEIAISDQLLKRVADTYRRIRNTARYLLGSLKDFDPARDLVAADEMVAVDQWMLARAAAAQERIRAYYGTREFWKLSAEIHDFCNLDLGSLYLDLLKDRLYTLPKRASARRSAQTALYHLAEALVRWIAPILSFTADEIWQQLPGERSTSVFAQRWHAFPAVPTPAVDFARLQAVREPVKKVLEDLRVAGRIGSGLNADVRLYADGATATSLRAVGEELRFWFITSGTEVLEAAQRPDDAVATALDGETLWISAAPSTAAKCERCWHQRADVGTHAAHPTLCSRCITNVSDANGEARQFI